MKQGDHPEVEAFGAGDAADNECPVADCSLAIGGHGLARVGSENMPLLVHEGDQIEGSGDTLVVISHGVRYPATV